MNLDQATAKAAKKLDNFKKWLPEHGAQVLMSTNEYELVRFKTGSGTSIIYTNSRGQRTYTGEASAAWNAFESGPAWIGSEPTRKNKNHRSSVIVRTLRQRDGDLCFFCQLPVTVEDESVEHLVPLVAGGPNHITNFFLAHKACNARVGCLSAPEKIAIHVEATLAMRARLGSVLAKEQGDG